MHHNLKSWPESFKLISENISNVQLRLNDRGFKVGDTCTFYEFPPSLGFFTGRKTVPIRIIELLENHEGLTPGWCLMVIYIPASNIVVFDAKLARLQAKSLDELN